MIQRIRCYFGKHLPSVTEHSAIGWSYGCGFKEDRGWVQVWAEVWDHRLVVLRCPCCRGGSSDRSTTRVAEITLLVPRPVWEKNNKAYLYFIEDGARNIYTSELGARFERIPATLREESK